MCKAPQTYQTLAQSGRTSVGGVKSPNFLNIVGYRYSWAMAGTSGHRVAGISRHWALTGTEVYWGQWRATVGTSRDGHP